MSSTALLTPQVARPAEADGTTALDGATRDDRAIRRPIRSIARTAARVVSVLGWLVVIAGALLLIVPALLGMDRYVITGNSMVPMFDRGSVVFSRAVPVEDLAVGDVITYRPPAATHVTNLVTHRITSVEEGGNGRPVFVTKGDANDAADPWEFQLGSDTQNVVQHHVPLVGHLLAFLTDPSNRMVVIGIPAGLIAVRALLDLVRVAVGRPDPEDVDGAELRELDEHLDTFPMGPAPTPVVGTTTTVDLTDPQTAPRRAPEDVLGR